MPTCYVPRGPAFGLVLLTLVAAGGAGVSAQAWRPPAGIPAPEFGIEERAPAPPASAAAEKPGQYFVDNTHAAASDSANFGTPAKPRRTIPPSVEPGSVVNVRGGPYTITGEIQIGGEGTKAAPIFYRGGGATQIRTEGVAHQLVRVHGAYVIVEGFQFVNSPPILAGHHLVLRDNEVRDRPPRPGGAGIYAGSSRDSVILRNHIHHNGDPGHETENDIHGVQVAVGAFRVWILENHMHHNGGDSVQVNSGRRTPLARFIYIGRNNMHEEGENAVDIKTAEDVIISENTMYGFKPTNFKKSGSDGSAIVINDDNMLNRQNNRTWIIFNTIYGSNIAIRTQAYGYVVGNTIRDIASAAIVSFGSHDVHVEHNTFRDVGALISRTGGAKGFKAEVINNLSVGGGSTISIRGGAAASSRSTGNAQRGATDAPPRAQPSSIFETFQKLYDLSIALDCEGRRRPAGAWAVGACESPRAGTAAR